MSPLGTNREELLLERSRLEASKYFSGSKPKARSAHGWLLFSSPFSPAVSLFDLGQNLSSISLFPIDNIWVVRMSE